MLKVVREDSVLLCIDKNNVTKLTAGKPIEVKGADIGLEKDIYIVYGETLLEVTKKLQIDIPEQVLKSIERLG